MTRESLIQELEEAAAKHGTELGALLLSVHNFLVAEKPETPAVEDETGAFQVADLAAYGELRGEKKAVAESRDTTPVPVVENPDGGWRKEFLDARPSAQRKPDDEEPEGPEQ